MLYNFAEDPGALPDLSLPQRERLPELPKGSIPRNALGNTRIPHGTIVKVLRPGPKRRTMDGDGPPLSWQIARGPCEGAGAEGEENDEENEEDFHGFVYAEVAARKSAENVQEAIENIQVRGDAAGCSPLLRAL